MRADYEHTEAVNEAYAAIIVLRRSCRRLHWLAGGKGYNGMGKREIEQLRNKLDEAQHWLNAATGSLNAGGARAKAEGL